MTALFVVYAGELLGTCDQQCYDAKGKLCLCPCAKRNHGVGYERALLNTRAMTFGGQSVGFATEVHHIPLFDLEECA